MASESADQAKAKEQYHAKVYFLYKIKEYFSNIHHALQKSKNDSIKSLLSESVSIQEEMRGNNGDQKKLSKSLSSQFRAILFWHKENPLAQSKFFKKDLSTLIKVIGSHENDYEKADKIAVYNHTLSLIKRIDSINIASVYVQVLKEDRLKFKHVDILLDSFVNELFFHGHSLKYLAEWYGENIVLSNISPENIDLVLDKIQNIFAKHQEYEIIYNCWVPQDIRVEFFQDKHGYTFIRKEDLFEPKIKETFKENSDYGCVLKRVKACDKYKAIEISKTAIENYMEAFRLITNLDRSVITGDVCFVNSQQLQWSQERLEIIENKINKEMDEREKSDIEDFIQLRKEIGSMEAFDVAVLQRSLFLVNCWADDYSVENRLLNRWSALEYILTFYQGSSIIDKVLSIIPAAISLYYIKDKMNVLWSRLKTYRDFAGRKKLTIYEEQNTEMDELFNNCKSEKNPQKYDKEKFLEYLASDKSETLYKLLETNIQIHKEMAELHKLLTDRETLKKTVGFVHDATTHDLTKIYRTRNKIVHSGKDIPENLDVLAIRLHRYLHCIIGIIIHYKIRNPQVSITEILYSINTTYNWYIDQKVYTLEEMGTPPYLFL